MEISSILDADKQDKVYSVSLEPGYFVDVKVRPVTGLVYVMQNGDGSTVYGPEGTDQTFPEYSYDEAAVISFVKEAHNKLLNLGDPLIYDPAVGERLKNREDLAGLVDVLSPQESADLFGRTVRSGDYLFLPCEKTGREDPPPARKAPLAAQIECAHKKNHSYISSEGKAKGFNR